MVIKGFKYAVRDTAHSTTNMVSHVARFKSASGFTLIELMIVLAIIGVLAAIRSCRLSACFSQVPMR